MVTINAPASCPGGYCASAWPSIGGGMMVYAIGVNGSTFATTKPLNLNSGTSASAQISLPNGQYMFYAVAWDGAGTTPFNGQAGCGQTSAPQLLTGGAQSVNLLVTQLGCSFGTATLFSDSGSNFIATGPNFGRPSIHPCNGITSTACTAASATYASTGSMRVRMEGYTRNGPGTMAFAPSLGITGSCYNFTSGIATTNDHVPVGSLAAAQNNFLATTVEFFTGTGCSGAPTKTVHFPNGFVSGTPETGFYIGGTGGIYDVYVDVGP